MGLQIGDLTPRRGIKVEELRGKVIAVDAYNALYQFLASIRQPDGTPLMDSEKRITSHLSGLFYRTISLLSEGVKLVWVFDGISNEMKQAEQEKRREARASQEVKFKTALEEEDVDKMRKYRSLGRLTEEMIAESKELLEAMGVAVVQAPAEGEMQAAQLVRERSAYAVASQDYDALAVGGRLIQNLTLAKTRKTVSGMIYISPELLEYEDVLQTLGVNTDQFISLAILVGTDFNPGGVKGIGPKKALALVKEKKFPVRIFGSLEGKVDFDWQAVFQLFKEPEVTKDVRVEFPKLDGEKIMEILVERHEFNEGRVEKQLDKLKEGKGKAAQTTLF
ncbi:flap endonuclease-1 [Candidatus Pacearchaeota archaeon]|nr:flap endonuclease-1 [Candidatus Pacearchaeota archaeon]